MKVLVTGANGFIGSHICEFLFQNGYQVRALVRKTSNLDWIKHLNLELAYGDLLDPPSIQFAVNGIDVVFHTAAVVRAKRKKDFIRVNQEGTRILAEQAILAGVKKLVFFSSIAAVGPVRAGELIDENKTPSPISNYGWAKLAAENVLRTLQEKIKIVILRLPAVYGPRDRDGFMLWRMMQAGWIPLIGGTFSLIYVADAVRAAVRAMEANLPSGATYFISDCRCYTIRTIAETWEKITGKKVRTIRVPFLISLVIALCYSWLRREGTIFNPDKIQELRQECWVCSSERARKDLGFEPEYDLCRGGEITLRWYKEKGWM